MISRNAKFIEQTVPIVAIPATTPGSGGASSAWIGLKNGYKAAVTIKANNGTTVTGSAITLKQATDATGATSKALGFTVMDTNLDTATTDVFTPDVAVVSNTFTTGTVNGKSQIYVFDIPQTSLDINNGFSYIQVLAGGAAVSTTVDAVINLFPLRYEDRTNLTSLT